MERERLETSLEGIRQLLSHLHGEVTSLEECYNQVLSVLTGLEGACNVDDLSGLLRRKPFFRKWQALLEECDRLNQNCGMLLIDIDHFKRVNDTHGHVTGDEVIRRVSAMLKQYESPNCFVGRYGGEEFAVAIRGSDAEILGVAEFIRRGVERLHGPVLAAAADEEVVMPGLKRSGGIGGGSERPADDSQADPAAPRRGIPTNVSWKCTVSVGMASAHHVGFDAAKLIEAADRALYQAKKKGRNQVTAA